MIDWEGLDKIGISKATLEQQGLLDSMLRGYKTNKLVPLTLNIPGVLTAKLDARLSLIPQENGQVGLAVHGIRKEPQLERPYFGFNFSEEDKKNLRETGNMGRAVELNLRGSEYTPCLISIDKNTNELVAVRQEHVYIPQEVSGVRLTDEEIRLLKEGQPVKVEGMTSKAGRSLTPRFNTVPSAGAGVHLPEEPGIQREVHRGRAALTYPDKDAQRGTYHPGRGHEVQEQGRSFLRVCHDRPDDGTAELHPS